MVDHESYIPLGRETTKSSFIDAKHCVTRWQDFLQYLTIFRTETLPISIIYLPFYICLKELLVDTEKCQNYSPQKAIWLTFGKLVQKIGLHLCCSHKIIPIKRGGKLSLEKTNPSSLACPVSSGQNKIGI